MDSILFYTSIWIKNIYTCCVYFQNSICSIFRLLKCVFKQSFYLWNTILIIYKTVSKSFFLSFYSCTVDSFLVFHIVVFIKSLNILNDFGDDYFSSTWSGFFVFVFVFKIERWLKFWHSFPFRILVFWWIKCH